MYEEGQETHYNQPLVDWHVPIMFKQVKEEVDYDKRRRDGRI